MDECIEIVRGLSRGEYFEYHGEFYDIPKIKITPGATEPLPILVGGHSDAALRRAVRLCDGWMHAGGDPESPALKQLRRTVTEHALVELAGKKKKRRAH